MPHAAFDNEICSRPHVFKIQGLAAVLAYIEAKQTQGKKISRHDE